MQAWMLDTESIEFVKTEHAEPVAEKGQVKIRLAASAFNHRDLNIQVGMQAARRDNPDAVRKPSYVVGADGAGWVEEVGEGVTGWQRGDEVLISSLIFCGQCEFCLNGEHLRCTDDNILGSPYRDGTMAESVVVPAHVLIRKPAYLTMEEAAALPMALGTAWRALMVQAAFQPGETVLVQGIGGGVSLLAAKLALSMGARVIVTSSSDEKLQRAIEFGAYAGINYRTEDVAARVKELTDGMGADVVIDGGGALSMPSSVEAARQLGRVVTFSMMGKERSFELPIFHLIIRQVSVIGSAMHTFKELQDAIRYIERVGLRPVISHTFTFDQVPEAIELMRTSNQFGKIVVTHT